MLSLFCYSICSSQDNRPVLPVHINDHKVLGLFDSGSNITAINWTTYCQIRSQGMRLRKSFVRLTSASNNTLHVMGEIDLPFIFGERKCYRPTVVCKGLKPSLIIGMDTMRTEAMVINMRSKQVTFENTSLSLEVISKTRVTIPARHELTILCTIKKQQHQV